MSKDKFQDKYDEIFQDMKEEKMDWDFEDFLQKAEGKPENGNTPVIPLENKKPSLPKWFWMAACLVLLFGIGFMLTRKQGSDMKNQAQLVENQIRQQKNDFIEENNDHQGQVAVNHPSDSVSGMKKDSLFLENTAADKDVLDEILPKRGRLKKETKPRFVDNSTFKNENSSIDSVGYKDSYVIVNGKRITSEEEAIDVAKYSFMKLGNEFKKTVASSQKNENFNSEY